jgi:hypothetical protein
MDVRERQGLRMVHPFPWEVEEALINNLSLPLQTLRAIRVAAKESARAMPITS